MKYNLSEIMKAAHQIRNSVNADYKKDYDRFVSYYGEAEAKRLGYCRMMSMSQALRMAWTDAKFDAMYADPETALFELKMQDRWSELDFDLARKLERRIRETAA